MPAHRPIAPEHLAWGVALMALASWRTLRPIRLPLPGRPLAGGVAGIVSPLVDTAVIALAVAGTGYWKSPFAFCLLTPVVAAGFARGSGFALRLALAASLAITGPFLLEGTTSPGDSARIVLQWEIQLLLVAALAGSARRLFGEAERRHSQTIDRLADLAEANQLLVSLHRVARQLPASLDLDTALASTVERLRGFVEADVCAVLLHDEITGRWTVAAGEGARTGLSFGVEELPPALRGALSSSVASLAVCLGPGDGLGPDLLSHSALYAPLRARGSLIGLVVLEHHAPGFYGRRDLQMLDGLVGAAGLAIDNARWFRRLRAVGAEEERVRIARNMHDRLGQSLASVAFGLDRLRRQVDDEPMRDELDELRAEVRGTLGEVRETLGDLRTDVTEARGMTETLAAFLERVEGRSVLDVNFVNRSCDRLPLAQEREMWRIAQEAITNAERHAGASRLSVRWECDPDGALLAVADDGSGFAAGVPPPQGAIGLRSMRERADAVGAAIEIDSAEGGGTVVRCRLQRW